jgi:hypothetical protein
MSRQPKRTAETATRPASEPAGPDGMSMPSEPSEPAEAKPKPAAELSREERDAAERQRMLDAIEAKRQRRANLSSAGWERIIGSDARCDNKHCRTRAQGSLSVYRVLHEGQHMTHNTKPSKGGLIRHETTRQSTSFAVVLCESCKLRSMIHEFGLDQELDDANQLPPRADIVALTQVALTPEKYALLRQLAMLERQAPTEPIEVPGEEHMRARQQRANQAETLTPLATNAVG